MATPIEIPDCAKKLLQFLYPTADWSRVTFFSGLPSWVTLFSPNTSAITLPDPLGLWGYRVYLGGNTDFCSYATLNTLVHECFHVQQFTGIGGGYGAGLLRPGLFKYIVCFFASECDYENNPYEIAAVAQETAFAACHKITVCDCATGEPVFNPAALDAIKACNDNLIVREPRVPECGTWWAFLLALIVVPILAVLAFIVHLIDLLDCTYLQVQSQQCRDWGTATRQECSAWADHGYAQCTQWTDEGYSACSQWADWGSNHCCDWWPCSWACDALVWVSSWVCVASVWISNLVCRASVWIANMVCIAWTWIVEAICLVWITILRTILLCWWR